jgi:hypothetical protein
MLTPLNHIMGIVYILIPAAIFIVLGLLAYFLSRRASQIEVNETSDHVYRVSKWFWMLILILLIGVIFCIISVGYGREGGWIVGSVVTLPISAGIVLPCIWMGIRSYIKVQNGEVFYHNGFKLIRFSLSGIRSCRLDAFFIFEIVHVRNPKKPIRIGVCYGNFANFIATCKRASKSE